jgi:alpha,alpha-trehalase
MKQRDAILAYIEDYWDECTFPPGQSIRGGLRNNIMHIGRVRLPHPAAAPNHAYFAGTQFYWDSYFTVLGLLAADRIDLARGMVDNLCWLYERFGCVPARNSLTSLGRSQPPFLTSMGFAVYDHGGADLEWLSRVMAIAKKEYRQVWMAGRRHDTASGLSRYAPRFWRNSLTVYESGWDRSSRFMRGRPLLPVDLNAQLFRYEKDLERFSKLIGDRQSAAKWREAAARRRKAISKHLWDDKTGYFYDYDESSGRRLELKTLAGYMPLWAGAASDIQARRCAGNIGEFETEWGLANTEKLAWTGRQWDYPNGWPPHQLLVHDGLMRYGMRKEAARIVRKYLALVERVFGVTGKLWEKYDVVSGRPGLPGRYPTQAGFAWTNAVYLYFYKIAH